MRNSLFLLPLSLVLGGCLYTDIRVPRTYRSATPSDVKSAADDPVVTGRGCNHSALFLVAWGDAGYAKAVSKALEGRGEAFIYDVKVDVKVNSYVLGLYTRTCTVVTGKVARP